VSFTTDRRIEEFRREAAKARLRAATDSEFREAFLTIAADWEALARQVQHLASTSRKDEPARI
jgi:hypothetical protein